MSYLGAQGKCFRLQKGWEMDRDGIKRYKPREIQNDLGFNIVANIEKVKAIMG